MQWWCQIHVLFQFLTLTPLQIQEIFKKVLILNRMKRSHRNSRRNRVMLLYKLYVFFLIGYLFCRHDVILILKTFLGSLFNTKMSPRFMTFELLTAWPHKFPIMEFNYLLLLLSSKQWNFFENSELGIENHLSHVVRYSQGST